MKDPTVRTDFLPDRVREQEMEARREELRKEWMAKQELIKSKLLVTGQWFEMVLTVLLAAQRRSLRLRTVTGTAVAIEGPLWCPRGPRSTGFWSG